MPRSSPRRAPRASPKRRPSPPPSHSSPARRRPPTPRKPTPPPPPAKAAPLAPPDDNAFRRSILVYLCCVTGLFTSLAIVLVNAPPISGSACEHVGFRDLIGRGDKRQAIINLYRCATAYQSQNETFVYSMFMLTYIGLKMFAIPAAFTLCVLSGGIFPLWQAQVLTGVGEAVGSSLCYLLSKAIARPVVERLFAAKLAMLQERAKAEREHMLLFNFFLRLTPLAPNWFINVASPIVGVPLGPFFVASLIGTQVTLFFQCGLGAALRTVGEEGFSLGREEAKKGMYLVLIMGVVQMIPIALIRYKKRLSAEASKAAAAKKA